MKLRVTIGGKVREVEISVQDRLVIATVDQRSYQLNIGSLENGSALLFNGDQVFDCRMLKEAATTDRYEVHVGRSRFDLELNDPRTLSASQASGTLADGVVKIIAPMPGKVVRVLVEQGAEVDADHGILVVEAMKMQNELRSPKAGIVSALNVSEGATVNAGDVLAVIE